jgi:dipeptidyl aminopeptidase/acylaminoacyl peptidase
MGSAATSHGPLTIEQIVGLEAASQWAVAPDGQTVAYIQDCAGIKQLWTIGLAGGWPRRITAERKDCSGPDWSPDSQWIAFIRDNGLYIARRDGADCRRLWKHESGIEEPRWSPDGAQVAFISRQRGWSQVWTIGLDQQRPRCITPEPDDHASYSWSPDGTRIAYVLRRANDLLNSDILVRTVGVEGGPGEALRLSAPQSLDSAPAWSPDGRRIAYISDADGWPHVWSVEVATQQRTQLTRGAFEDGIVYASRGTGAHWSPDGGSIAFVRNRDGKFDLMCMQADGGDVRRLSQRDGVRTIVGWLPDGRTLLTTFDSPQCHGGLALTEIDGEERLLIDALAGLQPEAFIAPERVSYSSRDGLTISGYLWRPREIAPGQRCPAIVYPHGGPTAQTIYRFQPFLSLLAQEGFVILAPDFRGSTGYGNEFRRANFNEWGHNDLFDVVDGASWLKQQPYVDPERVGIFGGSYGGYMTLCALAFTPEVFAAGVDLYGDSEIGDSYRHGDRLGRLDLHMQMGSPDDNSALYRRGSPVYAAERVQAPLLILHGREDLRVVPLMSERMIEALKIEGKYHEAHFYEGEGHGFVKPENKQDYMERVLRFLNRHLKDEVDA